MFNFFGHEEAFIPGETSLLPIVIFIFFKLLRPSSLSFSYRQEPTGASTWSCKLAGTADPQYAIRKCLSFYTHLSLTVMYFFQRWVRLAFSHDLLSTGQLCVIFRIRCTKLDNRDPSTMWLPLCWTRMRQAANARTRQRKNSLWNISVDYTFETCTQYLCKITARKCHKFPVVQSFVFCPDFRLTLLYIWVTCTAQGTHT
jgi:hypothetical protein